MTRITVERNNANLITCVEIFKHPSNMSGKKMEVATFSSIDYSRMLPDEVWEHIFGMLEQPCLAGLALVSSHFAQLCCSHRRTSVSVSWAHLTNPFSYNLVSRLAWHRPLRLDLGKDFYEPHPNDHLSINEALGRLSSLHTLQELYVWGPVGRDSYLSATELSAIASSLPGLRLLSVWVGDAVSDEGVEHLTALSHLRSLAIRYPRKLTVKGASAIARITTLKTLATAGGFETVTPDIVTTLGCLPLLDTLDFMRCKMDGQTIQALTSLRALKSLDVRECHSVKTTVALASLSLSGLKKLAVSRCYSPPDFQVEKTLKRFAASNAALTSLCLKECDFVTDEGLRSLSSLCSLRSLDIAFCPEVTDQGMPYIGVHTQLATLRLDGCLTDHGASYLTSLSRLTELNASMCYDLTSTATARLLSHLPALKALNVSENPVEIPLLLELPTLCSGLTSLDLWGCDHRAITERGISSLSSLRHLRSLEMRSVLLEDTVSPVACLTTLLPGLKVSYDERRPT